MKVGWSPVPGTRGLAAEEHGGYRERVIQSSAFDRRTGSRGATRRIRILPQPRSLCD